MSSRGGSSNNGVGVQSIPAASRKMVQSLKEIVNCPEQEIYAMLKECNMDPNDAVNRLLAQDPFHEVKNKRDKKKENKDTVESRSRGFSSTSSRGGRGPTDRYVGRGSASIAADSSTLYGKPAYKKENGTNAYMSSSSSASGMPGINQNRRPTEPSDFAFTESKGSSTATRDGMMSVSSQPSSGYQNSWLGIPGQVSMADIVKMGRPLGKASPPNPSHANVDNHHVRANPSTALHNAIPEGHSSKVSEWNSETGVVIAQNISPNDEWPLVEQPPATNVPHELEPRADSEQHTHLPKLRYDRNNQQPQTQADEIDTTEEDSDENLDMDHVGPAFVSNAEDSFGGSSLFNDDLHKKMDSYQSHRHAYEHEQVENIGGSLSSMTTDMQQLNIQEDKDASSEEDEEDHPSVVIPNHLQVQSVDCSHLSFGSFGSSNSAGFQGPFSSRPLQSNLEKESVEAGVSSMGHLDTRNAEYFGDEPLRPSTDGNLVHINGANAGSYNSPSASQQEVLKQDNPEAAHENQYIFPSSTPVYNFENAQQLNTGFSHSQTSSQMQNTAPFSSVMEYTNSLPNALLAANAQNVRESDVPYLPFPVAQALPTKYGNTVSSIGGSVISMPEALKTGNLLATQQNPQTLATGPALPQQHLAVHPYSQATLPLGPFANMIGYPFLPQSYTYMPSSAFQQAFAGNSTYHQSLAAAAAAAAVLPQYKNSASVSSLPPQSAGVASGYGAGFGSSTNISGNFNTPAGTSVGYDDGLSSQYKDTNQLLSLQQQQNENSGMWVHGPGSRTMSSVPASTYYSFQGQNQQPAAYRQAQQQPSQNYGAYPNYYHSQTGISLEHHQQQNPRDGSLSGSQAQSQQQQQQQQQLWQSGY